MSCAVCALLAVRSNGGEPQSDAPGPLVDVKLRNGESRKGYLLEYVGGQVSLKMETGEVVTRQGSEVQTVRFIPSAPPAAAPAPASAQETELQPSEMMKIQEFRRRAGRGNPIRPGKEPIRELKELSKDEEHEFMLLRQKIEAHIKALEREIRAADNDDKAIKQLVDFARSQQQYGFTPEYVKTLTEYAADSIVNPVINAKVKARSSELAEIFEGRFKPKNMKNLPPLR